ADEPAADEIVVQVGNEATLPEVISAIGDADWGPGLEGDDCAFLWGDVGPDDGLRPMRIATEDAELRGYATCDEPAMESVWRTSCGVLMGFQGEDLMAAHASDISSTIVFDETYATGEPRAECSVVISVQGGESVTANTVLPLMTTVAEAFASALIPIGRTLPSLD
ncbi:MAG: hypothetical protein AAGF12_25810, partial [Myxococcota bacterium]